MIGKLLNGLFGLHDKLGIFHGNLNCGTVILNSKVRSKLVRAASTSTSPTDLFQANVGAAYVKYLQAADEDR